HDQGNDEVSEIQTDFPPGKDEPASIADASPARSYANRIVNSWRHAADGMMEVARLCCEASQLLNPSEKKQLIKRLPFKESTFSKFVQIGDGRASQNPPPPTPPPAALHDRIPADAAHRRSAGNRCQAGRDQSGHEARRPAGLAESPPAVDAARFARRSSRPDRRASRR